LPGKWSQAQRDDHFAKPVRARQQPGGNALAAPPQAVVASAIMARPRLLFPLLK